MAVTHLAKVFRFSIQVVSIRRILLHVIALLTGEYAIGAQMDHSHAGVSRALAEQVWKQSIYVDAHLCVARFFQLLYDPDTVHDPVRPDLGDAASDRGHVPRI